jgi:hypothetical protein
VRRVATISDPEGDAADPTVDITDIAIARAPTADGRTQLAIGIRTAGGDAPPTSALRATYLNCRVASSDPRGSRTFTIYHNRTDEWESAFVNSYDKDLAAHGVTHQRTPWGHIVTITLDTPEGHDVVVTCGAGMGSHPQAGQHTSDETAEFVIEPTLPVEDVLDEIDEVFVPA